MYGTQYYGYTNIIYTNIYVNLEITSILYPYFGNTRCTGTPRRIKYRLNCKNGPRTITMHYGHTWYYIIKQKVS